MRSPLVACLLLSSVLTAQDPPPKVVSGTLGLDITSQYFFRGLLQENQGLIVQPSVELGYGLYENDGDGTLHSLDLRFGLWNSLHDGPTGGAGGIWYESNFYVGVDARLGERLAAGLTYKAYDTPNATGSFSKGGAPVQELVFSFDYDDRGMWFESIESGLRPSLVIAFEVDGQRDVATNGHSGIYAGLGIAPKVLIGQIADGDLTLTLPVTLGLSLRDYYERATGGNDDFFGYLDLGAELSAPLKFLPARMGPWDGFVGLHLLLLGDNQRARNSGDTSELILSAGFSTYF
ncbi:MAG: hypothetical protein JNM25_05070 [Planctomycetes bacterium]|nr:hypothetical protein [Planctomycetota bacterium]